MATYEPNDRYGAVTIASEPDKRDSFSGDPGLRIYAEYLQAFLNTRLRRLWTSVYDHRGPVVAISGNDPYEGVSTEDLPQLFVYRQLFPTKFSNLAPDLELFPSQIQICWIPPVETLEERKIKEPIAATVARAITNATQRGRDPSYRHPSDTDPNSVHEGTFIYGEQFMNTYSVNVWEGKWSKIDMYGSGDNVMDSEARQTYPALFMTINVEEMRERSFDEDSTEYDKIPPGALDLHVSENDTDVYPEYLRRIL